MFSRKPSLDEIRHSLAHLLAAAVLKKYPKTKLGIGPVIENGFYYDFVFPSPVNQEDLVEFESSMQEMIKEELSFEGRKITQQEGHKLFEHQPFKRELIEEYSAEGKELTAYKTGDIFEDLCRGGHVKNTKAIPADAFKLDKIAGAYWRGDEKREQMTRIYGLAFASKKELGEYLAMREEAEKRDHKKLGPELDLFTFSDLVGAGLPLWTPKGTLMRHLLDDFVWSLRKERGYVKVDIPHLTKKDLYEKSGHWEKFQKELFQIKTREGHIFALKPMNCPHHTQIFARKPMSYREMPQRYATTTMQYRDEQTGELSGLSRVRSISIDDAHVFARHSQIKEEINKIWDIIKIFYGKFGFELEIRLSLHDPEHPEKYLGDAERWKDAENILRQITKDRSEDAEEAPGEAAFYGPKVDFMAKDSLGRKWQVATIQLDMNQPERFDLNCINEKGEKERVAMIHAAIMGSLERFMSILIEHFAGKFPVWLAPTQVRILPVGEKFEKYGKEILEKLQKEGVRAEISDMNETLGKRIREAEMQKIPYVLVVGEKEESNDSVNVRHHTRGQEGEIGLEKFVVQLREEIQEKKF